MICSYLLHGSDVIRIPKTAYGKMRCTPSSSLQFENENDVTPSVINMNISCFVSSKYMSYSFQNITDTNLNIKQIFPQTRREKVEPLFVA